MTQSEALRFMGLQRMIRDEKNYIKQLERAGKLTDHREKILKTLEDELKDGEKIG